MLKTIELLKKTIQQLPDQTAVSIGILSNEQVFFEGLLHTNNEVKHTHYADTVFETGSITKAFTGQILAQWVLEGKVNLHEHIPADLRDNLPVTWAQLALHTSGLPRAPHDFKEHPDYDPANPFLHYNAARLKHYLSALLVPDTEPGSAYQYSNLGFGVLSYLAPQIDNKPFAATVQERIFDPLGMRHSSFATGISPYWDGGIMNGCLGILSTAADLIRFGRLFLDSSNEAVNIQLATTFAVEPGFHSNLGWGQRDLPQGIAMLGINGGTDLSAASLLVNRRNRCIVAVLTNIVPDRYMELIYPLNKALLVECSGVV